MKDERDPLRATLLIIDTIVSPDLLDIAEAIGFILEDKDITLNQLDRTELGVLLRRAMDRIRDDGL